jgi:light-regulated signal transduction histidine kinase (bacteriophytochrome)
VEAHAAEVRKREAEIQAELRRSNRDLEHFAHIASHDLQEPLRMVRGFLDLLRKKAGPQLDPEATECLNFALDGASRMSKLLTGLLLYARVGSQGVEPTPVSAEKALDEALLNLHEAVAEAGAVVERAALPELLYDATQLVQVLQNLIANAVKYRRPEVPPRIAIRSQRQDGGWLLSVRDNGLGMPPEILERVFDMFYRLERGGEQAGSGVGLAVCKRIVERHGGRIWVESQEGQGSTFHFTAPAAEPQTRG